MEDREEIVTGGSEGAGWGVRGQEVRDIRRGKIMKGFENEQQDFEHFSGQNW